MDVFPMEPEKSHCCSCQRPSLHISNVHDRAIALFGCPSFSSGWWLKNPSEKMKISWDCYWKHIMEQYRNIWKHAQKYGTYSKPPPSHCSLRIIVFKESVQQTRKLQTFRPVSGEDLFLF